MQYEVAGPLTVERDERCLVGRKQPALWESAEDLILGASSGCGCYIFGVKAGKGFTPWYVGKAEKQTFKNECFAESKLLIYREVMHDYGRGTPILFLIVRRTQGGRLSAPTSASHKDISYLEKLLISRGLMANPKLANVSHTRILREMKVPGLLNGTRGKPSAAVCDFKTLLNLW